MTPRAPGTDQAPHPVRGLRRAQVSPTSICRAENKADDVLEVARDNPGQRGKARADGEGAVGGALDEALCLERCDEPICHRSVDVEGGGEIGDAHGIEARSVETFQAFGFAEEVIAEAHRNVETCWRKPDPRPPREHRARRARPRRRDLRDSPCDERQDVATCCSVGMDGLEPTTFRSQSGRATKLRHAPSQIILEDNRTGNEI